MRRRLIGLIFRSLSRRFGWVVLAGAVRLVTRIGAGRRVDRVAADLEQRAPASIRRMADELPGDPMRAGAEAVVAAQSARRAATEVARATKAAHSAGRWSTRVGRRVRSLGLTRPRTAARDLGQRFEHDARRESELARRELRSRLLDHLAGPAPSDDLLLDLRDADRLDLDVGYAQSEQVGVDSIETIESAEPTHSAPVQSGRWRATHPRPEQVDRVQRTYQRPRRPWDRSRRPRP